MKAYNKNDLNGWFMSQTDNYNCGPIACMIMWYMFTHDEVDLRIPVEQYYFKVIQKLKNVK